jgi:predicted nucleotidyltransferase
MGRDGPDLNRESTPVGAARLHDPACRNVDSAPVGPAVCLSAGERETEPAMKPSQALEQHRGALRELAARYGVLRPRVFGSVLTGEDTDDSDLDLLVDPSPTTSLLTVAKLQHDAEHLLGVRVDVVTPKSLPIRFRERVLREAMPV